MSGYRLDKGGRIDRSRAVTFSFDGKNYQGFAGDTLASALLASGVMLFGRSFKYHRPRGRHHERWRHIHGCGRFFNAVRDTATDKFEVTYKAGEPRR